MNGLSEKVQAPVLGINAGGEYETVEDHAPNANRLRP